MPPRLMGAGWEDRLFRLFMYKHEKKILEQIARVLRERLPEAIISIYAFGSRVRGDHGEGSDFDVLVVVDGKTPAMEKEVVDVFVEEEMKTGIAFAPVIKDIKAFDAERRFNSPFYQNIMNEGVAL